MVCKVPWKESYKEVPTVKPVFNDVSKVSFSRLLNLRLNYGKICTGFLCFLHRCVICCAREARSRYKWGGLLYLGSHSTGWRVIATLWSVIGLAALEIYTKAKCALLDDCLRCRVYFILELSSQLWWMRKSEKSSFLKDPSCHVLVTVYCRFRRAMLAERFTLAITGLKSSFQSKI
jgi:hypothetical protein